jgi:hypothetical protein
MSIELQAGNGIDAASCEQELVIHVALVVGVGRKIGFEDRACAVGGVGVPLDDAAAGGH